jgi:hypothetical protein
MIDCLGCGTGNSCLIVIESEIRKCPCIKCLVKPICRVWCKIKADYTQGFYNSYIFNDKFK